MDQGTVQRRGGACDASSASCCKVQQSTAMAASPRNRCPRRRNPMAWVSTSVVVILGLFSLVDWAYLGERSSGLFVLGSSKLEDRLADLSSVGVDGNPDKLNPVVSVPLTEEEEKGDALTESETINIAETGETHAYQAEVNRMMDIIINSLYKQREVFLRELVSNGADALEKARLLSIADSNYLGEYKDLFVRVEFDEVAKTVTVWDSGVGMTKQDLINNLGTVAKSGTSNFLEHIAQGADVNLIGQFGVGFYSSFLVADRMRVITKNNDDEQYVWESKADASFTVALDPRGNTLKRGTKVVLYLKEDATDLLSEFKLKDLINRYSQFITFPISVKVKKTVTKEVPIEEDSSASDDKNAESEKKEGADDEVSVSDDGDDKEKKSDDKPKTKKVEETVYEWEQVNTQKPIWLRPKDEIKPEDYTIFYKTTTKDWTDPMAHSHFSGEGEVEFKAMLYVPSRAPMDMFDNYFSKKSSVKLYVRRVLVADELENLLPKYLHFLAGVVDSDDLPLNVSREELQNNKIIKVISKKLVRKALDLFKKMASDADKDRAALAQKLDEESDEEKKKEIQKQMKEDTKWDKFWKEFSKNLKLGCYEDDANRTKVGKILRFHTSKSPDRQVSLATVIGRASEKNKSTLFYAAGESVGHLMSIPQMQMLLKRGVEVLFLTEAMDEACVQKLVEYEGAKFVSVQKGDVTLEMTDEEKVRDGKLKKMFEPLLSWWKKLLPGALSKVEISRRLVNDPCTVVASQWGQSAYMEKIMKAQTFADQAQMKMMSGMKVLEVNPNHPIINDLLAKVKKSPDDKAAIDTAKSLYQAAMLASGFDVEDPSELVKSMYRMLSKNLGVDPDAPVEEVDVSSVEETETKTDDEEIIADDEPTETEESEDQEDKKEETAEKEETEASPAKDEL